MKTKKEIEEELTSLIANFEDEISKIEAMRYGAVKDITVFITKDKSVIKARKLIIQILTLQWVLGGDSDYTLGDTPDSIM